MKSRTIQLLLAAPSLFALASTAAAQQTTDQAAQTAQTDQVTEGSAETGDIVVTARRVTENLQDVPISITVFNQEQLTQRNVVAAGDLATYTPSLSVQNRFGGEATSFSIRGFTQEIQTSPSVGVYFADVVAPRAQGGTTAGNGAGVGSFFDLENVQVLKGPQGTLFGRNTTGGAVLLVPRKATREVEGYVEASMGNYDMIRFQAVVNAPLSENWRARLGVDRQKRDGFLNNISGVGPDDFADVDYLALRLSVVGDLADNLENYTVVSFSESDTNGPYPKVFEQPAAVTNRDPCTNPAVRLGFPAVCPTDLRAAQIAATSGDFYDISAGALNPFQLIRQWQVINTTTWEVSDSLTVKNIFSYSEFRQRQSTNIYGENPYQSGATLPYIAVNLMPKPGAENASQRTFTEEFQIQGKAGDKLNYQTGVYFEKSTPLGGFQTTYSANGLACVDTVAFRCLDVTGRGFIQESNSQYRFRNIGVYAQGTYKFTDQLSLTAGVRYTWDKVSGFGRVLKHFFPAAAPGATAANATGPNGIGCALPPTQVLGGTSAQIMADPSRCDFRRTVKTSKPTWMVDLDFEPNDDILLYAKFARGYRQGGLNVTNYGLETWGPEKVNVYEIGAKTSFRGAVRGYFNIAAFYNDFKDQQIAINTASCQVIPNAPSCAGLLPSQYPASAQGISSGASSKIKGIEIDASISPLKGLRFDAGYAYLHTKLKAFPDLSVIPLGFAALFPAAILNGPLAYSPKHKVTLTAAYTLPLDASIGEITLSGTYSFIDRQLATTSSQPNRYFTPRQNTFNLNLAWKDVGGEPVDLAFFITNLTNNKFFTNYTGSSFGWEAGIPNQPRMFGARARLKFGD